MKKKSAEQKAAHDHEKMIRSEVGKLSTRVKNQCKEIGLAAVKYQLEWLKDNPESLLPVEQLNHTQTVEAREIGIGIFTGE